MDDQELLQRAIDALRIDAVTVKSSLANLADDFDPHLDPHHQEVTAELSSVIKSFDVISSEEKDVDSQQYFRVLISCLAQLHHPRLSVPEKTGVLHVTLAAYYTMSHHPGDEALAQFAHQNAGYHIWPYWREFMTNQCIRIGLSPVILPMHQFVEPALPPTADEDIALSENAE